MPENLQMVKCDPVRDFMVQSHDQKELINFVKDHMNYVYQTKISDSDARERMMPGVAV
jgi:hypothetical protein